ncbi:(2E,6E)-farnesyl diphosphate synthase [Ferrimonas senticii]|uniref:(2E,6E)-farnesyl diphosphate synthase n=1 Tax=Ferrimonas senticii TaxID=394566 RepID=UPI00040334A2|nr:(2E,6E)-farnesyl diphosphate synthase [Ferrimonas senticii]
MLDRAICHYQTRVNNTLATIFNQLPITDAKLLEAMRYAVLLGGKRVRPFLVYASGEMLGAKTEHLDALAAAVECIHAYSLVHDDLPAMDNDALRRGQPTVHIAFDEATAILAGDALQTLAFEIIAECPLPAYAEANRIKMIQVLAKASGYQGMCGGQAIDLASTGQRIDINKLTQLHQLKTGALIRSAVQLGMLAAPNGSAEEHASLVDYAEKIGLAFQVQDDVLDIVGDTEQLGKPQGSDLAADKSTYPALLGLDGARDVAQTLYQDALTAVTKLPYNSELLEQFARYIIERNQ